MLEVADRRRQCGIRMQICPGERDLQQLHIGVAAVRRSTSAATNTANRSSTPASNMYPNLEQTTDTIRT